MTMYDGRTNLSQQVVDEVRSYFGDLAFGSVIPRTVRLSEAPSYGQPITAFDPSSRGARSYQRLARELAQRVGLAAVEADRSPLDALLGPMASPDAPDPAESTEETPPPGPPGSDRLAGLGDPEASTPVVGPPDADDDDPPRRDPAVAGVRPDRDAAPGHPGTEEDTTWQT